MGAGKTTVGMLLSNRLGCGFEDTDDIFASLHDGVTTGTYIARNGLEVFRPEEQAALRFAAGKIDGAVIATGGGVPVYPGNLEIMKASGKVVHIKVPLSVISSRMDGDELSKRPVWTSSSPSELRELYESRLPFYDSADIVVDGALPAEQVVERIVEALV